MVGVISSAALAVVLGIVFLFAGFLASMKESGWAKLFLMLGLLLVLAGVSLIGYFLFYFA